ncbi:amino acid ABC transporter permease [Vibrio hippocampi]|uniref:Glutamate/aspartate import permease protein GltK n=1 Tax=Vibrio hippocampi TaxID=654686 RepID=A0ABN8DIT7_9VIBR|nr:amino acid ABC transporter permease [Vibrio hippocampi]CAH0528950.1 Glutamate/aspartate import permease protein GltK [Vibrio hippocampi]
MPTARNTQTDYQKPRYQWQPLDSILLVVVGCFIAWLVYRSSAGIHYQWRWHDAVTLLFSAKADGSLPYFVQGIIATLRLSLWGMMLALLLGTALGVAKFSRLSLLNIPANIFVQLVRNMPPLVFIFIFYFFISNQLIPLLGLQSILREYSQSTSMMQEILFGPSALWENLLSGVLCVGLLSSAYVAEIVRAGLTALPKGQWEAGHSLGLSRWSQFRYVIGPQVIALITPALAGQSISLVKDTSIVSLISIQEMTFVGTEIANSSGLIFEIWLIIGACYFVACYLLSRLFRRIEIKSNQHLNHH